RECRRAARTRGTMASKRSERMARDSETAAYCTHRNATAPGPSSASAIPRIVEERTAYLKGLLPRFGKAPMMRLGLARQSYWRGFHPPPQPPNGPWRQEEKTPTPHLQAPPNPLPP